MEPVGPAETADTTAQRDLPRRIAGSKTFHRCNRLQDLLLDICEHTLSGDMAGLAEQSIGIRLFGRPEGYNPADDNIVRASVRQLRLKLKEYFETEGHEERLFVEIPKGGYVAVFRERKPQDAAPETEAVAAPPRRNWPAVALGIACVVLLGVCAVLWTRQATGAPPAEKPTLFVELLREFDGPVHVVITDAGLVAMNWLSKNPPTVEEYVSRSFVEQREARLPSEDTRRFWRFSEGRQITSLADVIIVAKLYQQYASSARRLEVRHARYMQPRDFKTGNFVITGSPQSNPWAGLFDSSANFQFDVKADVIHNRAPRSGEPAVYQGQTADRIDVARVAFAHNLDGDGFVLLLAGLSREGTEGAGEFILRPDSLPQIRRALHLGVDDRLPPFELILEVRTVLGTSRSARILAFRRH